VTTIGPTSATKHFADRMFAISTAIMPFWLLNYPFALIAAQNKPPGPGAGVILANFSGSDWCSHCIDLDNEVFKSATFKNWFKQHQMVPFLADYPQFHSQDPILHQQNMQLMAQYAIAGFPSVLALHADGSEIGRVVGYGKGSGPETWIQQFSDASGVA
jgi:thiol:disulfide interchange protein